MSVPLSNGSVRITWRGPTNSNGRILGYDVTYGPIGGVERALSATTELIILNGFRELAEHKPCIYHYAFLYNASYNFSHSLN